MKTASEDELTDRLREYRSLPLVGRGTRGRLIRDAMSDAADEIVRLRDALRSIAEGNLGDAPWQANYDRIRGIAAKALSR